MKDQIITKRQLNLLKILEIQETYISAHAMAQILQLSSKTVRNEIKRLNEEFTDVFQIMAMPAKGFILKIIDDFKFQQILLSYQETEEELILKKLLLYSLLKKSINQSELAEEFFVSESKLKKMIQSIRKHLAEYSLDIRFKNQRIEIQGDEWNIRSCMKQILFSNRQNSFIQVVENIFNNTLDAKWLYHQIDNVLKKHHVYLTDNGFINFLMHLFICSYRSSNIDFTTEEIKKFRHSTYYDVVSDLMDQIKGRIDLETEKYYIIYLLETTNSLFYHPVEEDPFYPLVIQIIKEIEKQTQIDLLKDSILIEGLTMHLKTTLQKRSKKVLMQKNMNTIRKNYPFAFDIAIIASKVIEIHHHLELQENDIAYLAIHFGAALLRMNEKSQLATVCIICGSGFATSRLMESVLKKRLGKDMKLLNVYNANNFDRETVKKADLLITTVPIHENLNQNTILIHPILTEDEINSIKGLVEVIKKHSIDFKTYIKPSTYYVDQRFDTKEEVLEFMTNDLVKQGLLTEQAKTKIFERESLSPTEIGNFVAIPHAMDNHDKKTNISIMTLDKPILWEEELVQVIILLNIPNDYFELWQKVIDILNEAILNQKFVEMLIQGCTYMEMIRLLNNI